MSEPFIAEIKIWGTNFAPRGWAFCDGQILPISQHTALFSIVGTIYGGDGRTTLAIPNLKGRTAIHAGRGPGLTERRVGEVGGAANVTLAETQIPNHNHKVAVALAPVGGDDDPGGKVLGRSVGASIYTAAANPVAMAAEALPAVGGGQTHSNQQPYLAINYCIALVGVFPSRS